jgi:hypothetical protein
MPKSDDRHELSQDALVEALVPDPDRLPDVVMLRGYLGKSGAEGNWRVYFTPELNDYVEIPADKILHSHRLPEDRGTMVWVPKGLVLEHKRVTSEDVQAEFLAGPITARLRTMGAADPLGMGAATPLDIIFGGHPSWVACPSGLPCPSVVICQTVGCPVSWQGPGFCGHSSGLQCQ